jgi:hypothetical protein
MTLFRHKNGLLYTIEIPSRGRNIAIPYKHKIEIGIIQKRRFREFKVGTTMKDFIAVAHT